MLINGKILKQAQDQGYAIGGFNICNLETLQGVTSAGYEEKAPVIVQITPGSIRYAGLRALAMLVKLFAKSAVVLHLDHGKDIKIIKDAINNGFTSVMIDASELSFEDNVRITRQVVRYAHKKNVTVEAELGRLGSEKFTDPKMAKIFVKKTNVDSLAVAIGTSHGAYKFKGKPKLDIKRLSEIRESVEIPLVLHGASSVSKMWVRKSNLYGAELRNAKGVDDDNIRKAIKNGICKINIDTDLRLAFIATVREFLAKNKKIIDIRKVLGKARDNIKDVVKDKIRLFGSSNKV